MEKDILKQETLCSRKSEIDSRMSGLRSRVLSLLRNIIDTFLHERINIDSDDGDSDSDIDVDNSEEEYLNNALGVMETESEGGNLSIL